jgi:hypothetical protein
MLECEKLEEVGWEAAFSNQRSAVSPNLLPQRTQRTQSLLLLYFPSHTFLNSFAFLRALGVLCGEIFAFG